MPVVAVVSPRAAALEVLDAAYGGISAFADSERARNHEGAGPALAGPGAPPPGVCARARNHEGAGPATGLFGFQAAAVERAERILARRHGVLIADGVGMGKTLVGAALALAAQRRSQRVLLVVPAGLRRQWKLALRQRAPDMFDRCAIVSHTALSRDADPEAGGPPFGRVVVDEAHAFRNPRTRRYAALARLTRAAEVVFLSATPINNSLLDLYFLIRLCAGDGDFADLGVPDLGRLFRLAALAPDAPPSPALAAVLAALVIRRPRSEAAGLATRGLRFPERAAPAAVRYDLTAGYRGVFEQAIVTIEGLLLAPYRLGAYGLPARAGAAELLRLLLAKRLESGLAAFRVSIGELVAQLTAFRDALGHGRLRTPADRPRQRGAGDQLLFEELLLPRLPPTADRRVLLNDTEADLSALRGLSGRLPLDGEDPKVGALRSLLFDRLARERVLVFTEFRDTALDLWRALRNGGGVAAIHGGRAYLGSASAGRGEVVRRFAPRSNGVREPPPHEAVRVLIATDVLSEGLNLQDAAHVVSYDLPWNPVRLIQRVGRIDRLGSLHGTVYAHHFLPDAGLERLLGLVERLRRKLAAIRTGLGAPAAATDVTDPDTRGIVERLATGDPTLIDALEASDAGGLGGDDPLLRLYRDGRDASDPRDPATDGLARGVTDSAVRMLLAVIRGPEPPASLATGLIVGHIAAEAAAATSTGRQRALDPPAAVRTGRTVAAIACVFASGTITVIEISTDRRAAPAGTAAAELLRRALDDPCRSTLSPTDRRAARRYARAAAAWVLRSRSSVRSGASSPVATALRRLRAAAAALPDGPDAALCTRIDRIITGLGAGLRAGREQALRELLDRWRWAPPADAGVQCDQLEPLLAEGTATAGEGAATVIALILVRGEEPEVPVSSSWKAHPPRPSDR